MKGDGDVVVSKEEVGEMEENAADCNKSDIVVGVGMVGELGNNNVNDDNIGGDEDILVEYDDQEEQGEVEPSLLAFTPHMFECHQCGYKAPKKHMMVTHMKCHGAEKPYKCDECDYASPWKHNVTMHKRRKHGRSLKDEQMEKALEYDSDSFDWEGTQLGSHLPLAYKCDQCEYAAKKRHMLIAHMKSHTGLKPFTCDECDYASAWKHNVTMHKRRKHEGGNEEKNLDVEDPLRFVLNFGGGSSNKRKFRDNESVVSTSRAEFTLHECSECDYKAKTKHMLITHMKSHGEEKPFMCDECNYASAWKHNVTQHKRRKHGLSNNQDEPVDLSENISSEYSDNEFNKLQTSRIPKEETIETDLYLSTCEHHICKVCGHVAKRRCNLLEHVKKHTGDKPFLCDHCDYASAWRYNLLAHIRRKHSLGEDGIAFNDGESSEFPVENDFSGEEQTTDIYGAVHDENKSESYKCSKSECNYETNRQYKLIEHLRTHTSEKQYSCGECGFTSSTQSTLLGHMSLHTECKSSPYEDESYYLNTSTSQDKPYRCDLCDYACRQKATLKRHRLSRHLGVKPYVCDICGYASGYSGNLYSHKRRKHGLDIGGTTSNLPDGQELEDDIESLETNETT